MISNAKCLTEGVDVPALDMVAFLTPKRSRVDIVQATGRAMRKADGKTTGYVLVPLFVEQAKGETIEEALARTEFDEVWNVLQAMQEQDGILAEIIRQMREERGRTKGFDDTCFCEKVEVLGPQISLEILRRSITTACINALADTWDERYGELCQFKKRFGHCHVKNNWPENRRLANWVVHQRQFWAQGQLKLEKIRRLQAIGFIWDPVDATWEERFAELQQYRRANGNCDVPNRWRQNTKLATWVSNQRSRKERLTAEQIQRLDELGFTWNAHESTWEKGYAQLKQYQEQKGDCRVPQNWLENPQLANFVVVQRQARKKNRLSEDQIRMLDALGFIWDGWVAVWEQRYDELCEYKATHSDCNVPNEFPENLALGRWVAVQRAFKRRGLLNEDRIRRLNELNFEWNALATYVKSRADAAWNVKFEELRAFRREHGHCNVPVPFPENPSLGIWVRTQRIQKRDGALAENRVRRLREIGFRWQQRPSQSAQARELAPNSE